MCFAVNFRLNAIKNSKNAQKTPKTLKMYKKLFFDYHYYILVILFFGICFFV